MWCFSALFILFLVHTTGSRKIIYIISDSSSCFMKESCLTLSMLAANISSYVDTNTVLIFQEGNHSLSSELSFSMSNIDNIFKLRLSTNNSAISASIICSENASLKFTNISQLWISRMKFLRCSSSLEFVQQFILEDSTYFDGDRALLATSSNLSITNSKFEHNTADLGGAILVQLGSNITINNCTFADNSATGCSDDNCHGGALFIGRGCLVEVKNSTFINNTSEYSGGAITLLQAAYIGAHNVYSYNEAHSYGGAITGFSNSNITVNSSLFNGNIAGKDGGSVLANRNSNITVDNSFFKNNKAFQNGGVLFAADGSKINVNNSCFNQNEAGKYKEILLAWINGSVPVYNRKLVFENLTSNSGGGVMYASQGSSISMDNSSFSNNTGSYNGGVFHANTHSTIILTHSSFSDNIVGNDGGVAFAHIHSSITVSNTSFNTNAAISGGGVLFASHKSDISVNTSTFHNNEAGRFGGALFVWRSSSITVYNSRFDSNTAGKTEYAFGILLGRGDFDLNRAGGAVFVYRDSNITTINSYFTKNEAGACGGCLFVYNNYGIIRNCTFNENSAGNDGGVIYADLESRVSVNSTIFSKNLAGKNGGVIYANLDSIVTLNSSIFDNNVADSTGGVVYAVLNSTIAAENCTIYNNTAGNYGGFAYAGTVSISIRNCFFNCNLASIGGGVLLTETSFDVKLDNNYFRGNKAAYGGVAYVVTSESVTVNNSYFEYNQATQDGGVIYTNFKSKLTVEKSLFTTNEASYRGGVLFALYQCNITFVNHCLFLNNTATEGGVMNIHDCFLSDQSSEYSYNKANDNGGVVAAAEGNIQITASNFTNSIAAKSGGVFYTPAINNIIVNVTVKESLFHNNSGDSGGVIAMLSNGHLTLRENTFRFNFAHKGGVVFLQKGNHLTINNDTYIHNLANGSGGVIYSECQNNLTINNCILTSNRANKNGGVIYSSVRTEITITGNRCTFMRNKALNGGAMFASKSKILVRNYCLIRDNLAISNGGGFYLTMSELKLNNSYFNENIADKAGGGIHAASSRIIIEGIAHFTDNEAENGGGISLESNTKLIGNLAQKDVISFVSNRARNHGGALFVDDQSNPDLCAAIISMNMTSITECFTATSVSYGFSNNHADASGSNLFGGLLDRCTVHGRPLQKNEIDELGSGLSTFQRLSNISEANLDTIRSHPVRMCFCRDNQPDCDYQPEHIQVNRGKGFSFELIAYDQVSRTVNAMVHSTLTSSTGGLDEGQETQHINETCTELHFNLFTPLESDYLTLSLVGPCSVVGISTASIRIDSTCSCPIGFQILDNNKAVCNCVCDKVLLPYDKTECNSTANSIIRKENFWITYVNETNNSNGYLIYPNCPFDYCHPPENHISVNLNLPNGSDAQCASNRTGTLCGYCKPGLSVSLGSTHCLRCPTYWPGLLVTIVIVAIFSGIGLVALILILNLTVAVGTLNAIIFYANIISANRGVLFATSEASFAYVVVSWLNFDLGIDICFLDGMDTYVKTWLQLAYMGYIIFLVILIIELCGRFDRFGRLLGKKDPVATLATLVLLSNTKLITLLQTIISTLLPVRLKLPDGSQHLLWLPDATVGYLSGKHAMLFVTAILVLLIGLVYTFLLFSWQWILCCPRKRVKWIRSQKLSLFLESYHVPYTPKHRYWTGLLLLTRGTIYFVLAFNSPGDPRITLFSTIFIVSYLLFYIAVFGIRMYKHRFINTMEIFTYINIISVSMFAWYNPETNNKQDVITNVSVGITLVQLLVVILYHVCTYTRLKVFSRIHDSLICKKLDKIILLKQILPREYNDRPNQQPPANNDVNNKFLEFLDMVDRSDDVEPTYSIVEIPKPHLTPPQPLDKITEEPESEIQRQLSIQEDTTEAKDNPSAVKVSDADNSASGDIGPTDCSMLTEETLNLKSSDSTNKTQRSPAKLPDTAFTQQLPQTSSGSEGASSHCITVEVEVYDQ